MTTEHGMTPLSSNRPAVPEDVTEAYRIVGDGTQPVIARVEALDRLYTAITALTERERVLTEALRAIAEDDTVPPWIRTLAGATAEPNPEQGRMVYPKSIEELEHFLNSERQDPIEILQDGSIRPLTSNEQPNPEQEAGRASSGETDQVEVVAALLEPTLFGPDATHPAGCPYCDDNRDSARKTAREILAALSSTKADATQQVEKEREECAKIVDARALKASNFGWTASRVMLEEAASLIRARTTEARNG